MLSIISAVGGGMVFVDMVGVVEGLEVFVGGFQGFADES